MLTRKLILAAALAAAAPLGIAQTQPNSSLSPNPVAPPVAPVGQFNGAVIAPGGAIGTTPGTGGSNIGTAAGVGATGRLPESSSAGSSTQSATPLPSDASRGVLGPAPVSPGVIGGATTPPAGAPGPCVPGSMVNPC